MSDHASPSSRVTVTDIDMPFGSMVSFMVKWAIASIPAVVILFAILLFAAAALRAFFAGFGIVTW